MVSVVQVYNAVKNIANKEQKGFITPAVFNSFAPIAQMSIYNEMFAELISAKRINRQNFDPGRDKSVRKQKLEDLAFYKRRYDDNVQSGTILKPSDLSRIISITAGVVAEDFGTVNASRVDCDIIYDPEKFDRISGSLLSGPTHSFPIALVSTNTIEIIPVVSNVVLNYYAKPTSFDNAGEIHDGPPFYSVQQITTPTGDQVDIPNSSSRDFMLPPHYLNEVVAEILKLIGVRLRDNAVSTFSIQEEASE
tara:strand:+ start:52 stop:801 length:750 start_codon:yes stop_codon:yes gene_type:complete